MASNDTKPLLDPDSSPRRITFVRPQNVRTGRQGHSLFDQEPSSSSGDHSVIKFNQKSNAIRTPFLINSQAIDRSHDDEHINTLAQYHRYRYYTKLHGHKDRIVIPDHVLPSYLFLPLPTFKKRSIEEGRQISIITITVSWAIRLTLQVVCYSIPYNSISFSRIWWHQSGIFAIWNTMMGTSLLSMPWAITQSGLGLGIGIMVFMGGICLFTCLLILKSASCMEDSEKHEAFEFSDVCYRYLGKWGKYTCVIFSVVALLGAAIVYWVLLSNFLFSAGEFTYDNLHPLPHGVNSNGSSSNVSHTAVEVLCAGSPERKVIAPALLTSSDESLFFRFWKKELTVPFYLVLVLFPLTCLKSPTFFTKFNALGTLAVFYMLVFIVVKAVSWKINVYDTSGSKRVLLLDWSSLQFPSLSGTLGLALYIHNCIISITRNQANPKNNTRDVCVAYILATGTYLLMAVVCYICFPLAKSCIHEVFLDNFPTSDVLTFTAQVFLLFQMVTVYPLILYIIRVQVLSLLFGKVFPGWLHVIVLNSLVIGTGIAFAVFYPHVGHIIRYVGSISALVYIFGLPCIVHMVILHRRQELRWPSTMLYCCIVLLGVVNLMLQFFVS